MVRFSCNATMDWVAACSLPASKMFKLSNLGNYLYLYDLCIWLTFPNTTINSKLNIMHAIWHNMAFLTILLALLIHIPVTQLPIHIWALSFFLIPFSEEVNTSTNILLRLYFILFSSVKNLQKTFLPAGRAKVRRCKTEKEISQLNYLKVFQAACNVLL